MNAHRDAGTRAAIAAAAAARYRAGESWAAIAVDYGLSAAYLRRLAIARHDVTFQRWGQRPIADVEDVRRRRAAGESITQIAAALGCSRTAVRTAVDALEGAPETRYPRLAGRRAPTERELEALRALYEACPPAARNRPGHRETGGAEGRPLAAACRALVEDGVPMQTLARALGRGPTWVHWLLVRHDERPRSLQLGERQGCASLCCRGCSFVASLPSDCVRARTAVVKENGYRNTDGCSRRLGDGGSRQDDRTPQEDHPLNHKP